MINITAAIDAIDKVNAEDPNQVMVNGVSHPAELLHSIRLTEEILSLDPEAGPELLVAARSQHIARWKVPRSSYPEGKAAYLTWRKDLAKMHAGVTSEILARLGFDDSFIKRVHEINLKQNLKFDRDVQVMEDGLCLVFMRFQLDQFLLSQSEEKMITILQKSWKKMSEAGRKEALKINFSPAARALVLSAIT
jgi:hypothetical protein